MIIESVA